MEIKKPLIIAVAAVSGGGKTTIITGLKRILPNSKAFFFDDYEFDGPNDICNWVERGADYNEWKLTPLINDICSWIYSHQPPLDYLLLDYPFAYVHYEIREYIDFAIFIDTPLDIAIARRILRDFKEASIDDVRNDLNIYLSHGRDAYLEMLNTIKPNCDIIVDGSLPPDVIVNQLYKKINEISKQTR